MNSILVDRINKGIESRQKTVDTSNIMSGLISLDRLTGGLKRKTFTEVFDSESSLGKTSLALQYCSWVTNPLITTKAELWRNPKGSCVGLSSSIGSLTKSSSLGLSSNVNPLTEFDSAILNSGSYESDLLNLVSSNISTSNNSFINSKVSPQKFGGVVLYINIEQSISKCILISHSIDLESIVLSSIISPQIIVDVAPDLVIIDSLAAIVPDSYLSIDYTYMQLRKVMREFFEAICITNSACLILNQSRSSIFNGDISIGEPKIGGWFSTRLELSPAGNLYKDYNLVGKRIRIDVSKRAEKIGSTELDMYFNNGFCIYSDFLDTTDLINRKGSWYQIGDKNIRGREEAINYLKTNV